MGLFDLVSRKVLAMTKVEDAIVDGHMRPVWATAFGYAELADHIKLLRRGVDETDKTTTLIIDEKFSVGSDDGTLSSATRPFFLIIGLTCCPVNATPVTIVVRNPV